MFATNYATDYRVREDDDDDNYNDVLPSFDKNEPQTSSKTTLTDCFGKMTKCQKEAIIRFRQYKFESEPTNRYRAKLMYSLYVKKTNLLGGYSTYKEHYNNVEDLQIDLTIISRTYLGQNSFVFQKSKSHSLEGSEVLTEVAQEDLEANTDVY